MSIDTASGLPLSIDEATGILTFHDGLLCEGDSQKLLGAMEGLFRSIEGEDPDQLVYRAYRNIRFAEHESLWLPNDLRYDITVLMPGTANGEYYKTSGHYHGRGMGKALPYPELYEVIKGTVAFVLQCDPCCLDEKEGNPTAIRVVVAREGEAVIIPPYWGHGSINVADEVSAFSNIAVASCPVIYDAVKARHGLAAYVMQGKMGPELLRNEHYEGEAMPAFTHPNEHPEMGVTFGRPCYRSYIENPACYNWLVHNELFEGYDTFAGEPC